MRIEVERERWIFAVAEVNVGAEEDAIGSAAVEVVAREIDKAGAVLPEGIGVVACAHHAPRARFAFRAPGSGLGVLVFPSFLEGEGITGTRNHGIGEGRAAFAARGEGCDGVVDDTLKA